MLEFEPWSYLRDMLCLIPSWPAHRLLELAPVGDSSNGYGLLRSLALGGNEVALGRLQFCF
jgi:hypothetical protein